MSSAVAQDKVAATPAAAKAPKAPKEKKPKAAATPAAAKAPKAPKEKKPKAIKKPSAPAHPPYFQMIKDAILALHERAGSSPHAIAKHIEEKHKGVLPPNYKKILAVQLRGFAAKGKLARVKNSFKLAEPGKKAATGAVKKEMKGVGLKKKTKPVASLKSPKVKAKTAKKVKKAVKPKQPKSIKSSAKKMKKVVA